MSPLIEKLKRIFKLEAELGYTNKAVVGGLDKFLPSWISEAQIVHLKDELIQAVVIRINQYRLLDQEERALLLNEIIELLQTAIHNSQDIGQPKKEYKQRFTKQNQPSNSPQAQEESTQFNQTQARSFSNVDTDKSPGLNAPLTVLHGIGPRNAQSLEPLGLKTLEDLLYYFPRRYDDFSQLKPINRIQYGEELTILGTIQSITSRPVRGGQIQIVEAVLSDGTGFLRLTWFNQPWLVNRLPHGTQIIVSGKIDMYLGRLVINSPEWEPLDQDHLHTNRIVPVYSLSSNVTQRWLRKMMHQTVSFWAPRVPDYLPESIRSAADLTTLSNALRQIHFPDSMDQLNAARARLAFDEILFLQLGVLSQKRSWQSVSAQIFSVSDDWLNELLASLPFTLTDAQQKVLAETRVDLSSGSPMNRLLQGDVGSGKTVIAALAVAIIAQNGAQSAIMAPTSILAEQHYRTFSRLLSDVLCPEEISLLLGDTPESEKRTIRAGLADGSIKLVIGTHALIEDPVDFQRLQLAVIDEQHRFGVSQRSILRSKGENPHLLVMTATPIPRSLALTIYGDLDLSVMDQMPFGRLPVETHVLHPLERERAYQLVRSQIALGQQAFIIYPLVEQGDREESKAAVEEHARLQKEIFPKYRLGLVHGRLKPEEKESAMVKFRDGEYQILISTSVVEVGVDVPNATVMIIEGANRFGLAQLHQFRGRVGRGSAQSFCLLIPETENALENERLATMEATNDGFVLAEKDLQQRGPGDFLGTRQSGFLDLRMANLTDIRLIEKARTQAQRLFEQDPDLTAPEHQPLVASFRRYWGNGRGDMS